MHVFDSREGYDLYAQEYKKDHVHLDSFDWDVAGLWGKEALQECKNKFGSFSLLDAGCGDGRVLNRWVKKTEEERVSFFGADISPQMLHYAAKRVPKAKFSLLDLQDEDAVQRWISQNGLVQMVSAFFLLVHFPRPEVFFQSTGRLIQSGGILLMNSIPQDSPPELEARGKHFYIKAFDHKAQTVEALGNSLGFTLKRNQDCFEKEKLISTVLWFEKD